MTKNKITDIIFDYGGVISFETTKPTLEYVSKIFDVGYKITEETVSSLVPLIQVDKLSNEEFWKEFSKETNSKLPENYLSIWEDTYRKFSKVNLEMIDLVKKLKQNYNTSLLSNTIKPHSEFNKSNGRYSLFEPLIISCDEGMKKPDPKIYEKTLYELNSPAENCIFIDDKLKFVEAANNVGIHSILFSSQENLEESLSDFGVKF